MAIWGSCCGQRRAWPPRASARCSPGPGLVPIGEAAHQTLVILLAARWYMMNFQGLLLKQDGAQRAASKRLWSFSGSTMRPEKARLCGPLEVIRQSSHYRPWPAPLGWWFA